MASIFTRIINREIPGFIVAEDEHHIAFLDINPLVKGHTLVVPKQETDYLYDLDDHSLSALHVFSKKVAGGLVRAIPCERIGVTVIGLEVPHCHIHLIPINNMEDMNFSRPKLSLSKDELSAIAEQIKTAIQANE